MTDTTPTPAETLKAATQLDVPLRTGNRPTLIGTFVKETGNTAIIRTLSGRVRQVAPGDRIGQALVTQIDDGAINLELHKQRFRLSVPEAA